MKKLLVIVGCLLFFAASCGNKVDEEFLEGTWISQNDAEGKIIFDGETVKLGENATSQTYAIASDDNGKFNITFQREETGGIETYYFQKESKNKIKVTKAVLDSPSDERLDEKDLNTEYKKEDTGLFSGFFNFLGIVIVLGLLFIIGYLLNKRVKK
ncbi:hypothetical protein HFD07_10250 [Staphylococcus arlettae]|uniref:Lipoprotein n=1 Tax=Staphylococcus arlettae TaxID=29378 RepID=A0A380CCB0_9STAP|nr:MULTISPECIES: hypothetical protein [Staphylococcus]MEB5897420.1 hypothetical protein [Staphylococcus arlettae]NKE85533.1 hypothetical protein [Staphylococcus arlettae]PNZ52348.1 hypothetical protein CD036_12325 [Staphylococcus arlettae]URN40149.1 hypothetical protein NAA64_05190 [Staphylococcus arlettae]SUJ16454.1 Uncharacterised protein [Staphylococcus arlettae]